MRVGEARIAFRAVAFAGIKIVPDSADEAVGIAWQTGERASEHFIGGAVAVNVRRHESADAALVSVLNDLEEAFFAQRLAEVHVASAAPGSVCGSCEVHKQRVNKMPAEVEMQSWFLKPRMDTNWHE